MKRSFLHRLTARFRKNRLYGNILANTGQNLHNRNWIFILGCYNSGTTLLNQLLAGHPQIGGLPDEGVMLTDQLLKPEDFGWRRMWWKCEDQISDSWNERHNNSQRIKRQWSHFYPQDKLFLLEKSISNVCRIPFLNREFQPAYFIHIVRNGYAVAEGIRRKAEIIPGNQFYKDGDYPIELCINQWVKSLEKVEKEQSSLKRFLEISYEELTENPEGTIQKVTDFLGLPPFPEHYFKKDFSVHEKTSEIKNMNSNSFKRLNSMEIEVINGLASDYLIKKGYPIL